MKVAGTSNVLADGDVIGHWRRVGPTNVAALWSQDRIVRASAKNEQVASTWSSSDRGLLAAVGDPRIAHELTSAVLPTTTGSAERTGSVRRGSGDENTGITAHLTIFRTRLKTSVPAWPVSSKVTLSVVVTMAPAWRSRSMAISRSWGRRDPTASAHR